MVFWAVLIQIAAHPVFSPSEAGSLTLTRAIQFLEDRGILFEVAEYAHLEKGALFASRAIGMPAEQTVKTLVVELAGKGCLVVLMRGNKAIPLKKLARKCGARRASIANPATAERLTGYVVGGMSPFGTRQSLRVMVDDALLAYDKVAINGGKRGLMLIMNPADIVRVTDADPITL
ncbi:MAG: YbaK/EbsC family protein [Deltaproteobacteria bacterium]